MKNIPRTEDSDEYVLRGWRMLGLFRKQCFRCFGRSFYKHEGGLGMVMLERWVGPRQEDPRTLKNYLFIYFERLYLFILYTERDR